jgi:hypothetical protein
MVNRPADGSEGSMDDWMHLEQAGHSAGPLAEAPIL